MYIFQKKLSAIAQVNIFCVNLSLQKAFPNRHVMANGNIGGEIDYGGADFFKSKHKTANEKHAKSFIFSF